MKWLGGEEETDKSFGKVEIVGREEEKSSTTSKLSSTSTLFPSFPPLLILLLRFPWNTTHPSSLELLYDSERMVKLQSPRQRTLGW